MKLRINTDNIFKGKEHYLAFRAAWARNSNGPSAAQHLLYALLRGHDAYKSFTPTSNYNKLSNGTAFTHGLYYAMQELQSRIRSALKEPWVDEPTPKPSAAAFSSTHISKRSKWEQKWLDDLLAPFEGTVDYYMLAKISEQLGKDPVPLIFSAYGIGRLIHMKHEFKPISYAELWDMYEEVQS